MRVIIVGAGLGGLALALALARAGIDATVVERAAAFGEAGAGIQLSPNATRALFTLGLQEPVRAIGFEPQAAEVRNHKRGRLLLSNALGEAAQTQWGAPYLQVHRADLHKVLLAAVQGAGRTAFRLGERVDSLADGGVRLAGGEHLGGEVVAGCDGLRSTIRAALFSEPPARFTGQVAWRGLVPAGRVTAGLIAPIAQVWIGARSHFVHYPVRGGTLINFIAVTEERDWRVESWSEPGDRGALLQAFAGWPPSVLALIGTTDEVWRWALYDRPPLARWSKGRATLLGDAAHPMLPFLAQGAAMAIEDAVVLARCLTSTSADGDPVLAALGRYEQARRNRTAKAQAWSRRNALLFHLPGPVAAALFGAASELDRMRPSGGAERFDWLYGYDAATTPI